VSGRAAFVCSSTSGTVAQELNIMSMANIITEYFPSQIRSATEVLKEEVQLNIFGRWTLIFHVKITNF
jgi:hypothetical protein